MNHATRRDVQFQTRKKVVYRNIPSGITDKVDYDSNASAEGSHWIVAPPNGETSIQSGLMISSNSQRSVNQSIYNRTLIARNHIPGAVYTFENSQFGPAPTHQSHTPGNLQDTVDRKWFQVVPSFFTPPPPAPDPP